MGASTKGASQLSGRRRRTRRHAPMSEINVTPFVDVMLVLLIIFMVAAPLLTVGVPIELPESKGKQLKSNSEPLVVSVDAQGNTFIGETKLSLDELAPKLKAIAAARKDDEKTIFVRGDKGVPYGVVLRVMGRINAGGFTKVSLVSEVEDGG